MAEVQAEKPKRGFKWLLTGVAVVGLAAVLYVIVASVSKPSGPADLKKYATGSLSKLVVAQTPVAPPPLNFTGPDGKPCFLDRGQAQVSEQPGVLESLDHARLDQFGQPVAPLRAGQHCEPFGGRAHDDPVGDAA